MSTHSDFGADYAAEQLARQRSPLRRLIKARYVQRVLRHVQGPTIDVGCGAGQILEKLPAGSVGLEVNPYLIASLRERGLNVRQIDATGDRINLAGIVSGQYRTLVLSHVLEHFVHAEAVLQRLLQDCAILGLDTVIVVVPGLAGYQSDATHRTFVHPDWLSQHDLQRQGQFALAEQDWFPVNAAWPGRYFAYHELHLVYRRNAA